jgi:ribosomal protein L34
MSVEDAAKRKQGVMRLCEDEQLLDYARLVDARILNEKHQTTCPLCLKELSSQGFFNRMEQAEGREVLDLTVTELNLFHIEELRMGGFNHRPYNLGWGHHHCNVVVKDAGIQPTLRWMHEVIARNIADGRFTPEHPVSAAKESSMKSPVK